MTVNPGEARACKRFLIVFDPGFPPAGTSRAAPPTALGGQTFGSSI
jgi:hypothetical protein